MCVGPWCNPPAFIHSDIEVRLSEVETEIGVLMISCVNMYKTAGGSSEKSVLKRSFSSFSSSSSSASTQSARHSPGSISCIRATHRRRWRRPRVGYQAVKRAVPSRVRIFSLSLPLQTFSAEASTVLFANMSTGTRSESSTPQTHSATTVHYHQQTRDNQKTGDISNGDRQTVSFGNSTYHFERWKDTSIV